MISHKDCCAACQQAVDELVQVLTRCIGVMEMAKIGDMSLYDSAPLRQAKRLLVQIQGNRSVLEEETDE